MMNHRLADLGRNTVGPSAPTPAPEGTPLAGCPRPCPGCFGRSPRRSHSLSGETVLDTDTAQKCFPVFRGKLLCSSLYPLPLVTGIYGHGWDPPEPPFLQAEQSQLYQLLITWEMFKSLHHLGDTLLDSLQYVCVPFVLVSQHWIQLSRCDLPSTEQRGRIVSLDLLVTLYLVQLWFVHRVFLLLDRAGLGIITHSSQISPIAGDPTIFAPIRWALFFFSSQKVVK